jgi:hypothetical protein
VDAVIGIWLLVLARFLAGYTQPLNTTDLTPFTRVGTHFVNNTCVVLNTVIHTLGKTFCPCPT